MEPDSIYSSDTDNHDPKLPDPSLIERYWLGETSYSESEMLDKWFAANPVWKARHNELHRNLKSDMRSSWEPLTPMEIHNTIDKVLTTTGIKHSDVSADRTARLVRRPQSWMINRPLRSLGIAVVCTLVFGLGWVFSNSRSIGPTEQTYTSGIGQRINITLVDGTRVTLAPQSMMHISAEFGSSTRTVSLDGEAHFDVTSADRVPFIVKTGNTHTRVLGTRFVVKYYDDKLGARIAVESGRVAVGRDAVSGSASATGNKASEGDIVITPGQVVFSDSSGLKVLKENVMADYTDWLHSRLTFRSTPTAEALETLTRWYGVKFKIADSELLNSSITGSLPYGSLEDMLTTLRDLLDVSMSQERSEDGNIRVNLRSNTSRTSSPSSRESNLPPTRF